MTKHAGIRIWSDLDREERCRVILEYAEQGDTGSEVCEKLYRNGVYNVTRNALISHIHRCMRDTFKLSGRANGDKPKRRKPTVARRFVRISPRPRIARPIPKPTGPGKMLMELEAGDCRFPIDGEGEFARFCASPAHGIGSYCQWHKNICSTKMEKVE